MNVFLLLTHWICFSKFKYWKQFFAISQLYHLMLSLLATQLFFSYFFIRRGLYTFATFLFFQTAFANGTLISVSYSASDTSLLWLPGIVIFSPFFFFFCALFYLFLTRAISVSSNFCTILLVYFYCMKIYLPWLRHFGCRKVLFLH